MLAGVSEQVGCDLVMLFDESVNSDKFLIYLDTLRAKYFFDDICLYMDNLNVHRSRRAKDRMEELGIAYIFNPIYSPELNGIEETFSIVKRAVKARRLQAILDGDEIDLKQVIYDSFQNINRLKIAHCI